METAIRPGIYDESLADEDVRVSTERAFALTRRLATEEGLLVGVSSGAALAATLDVAGADPRRRHRDDVSRTAEPATCPRTSGTRIQQDPASATLITNSGDQEFRRWLIVLTAEG